MSFSHEEQVPGNQCKDERATSHVIIGDDESTREIDKAAGSALTTSSVITNPDRPKSIKELIALRAAKRTAREEAAHAAAEGHKGAGDVFYNLNNFKYAVTQYSEAIRLWGKNPSYFICLANAYHELKWHELTAHTATQCLTIDPKNNEARYIRGRARLQQRLLKPAQIDFATVVKHDPSNLIARAALSEVTAFIDNASKEGKEELGLTTINENIVDFGFPAYDQEALEVAEYSDSSDCNHLGNGIQCRFYNHGGCEKGYLCVYSHAPDEKSIRDDLGKNVCVYNLIGNCKFGPTKCFYAHSSNALPERGWWTNPEQIAKFKAVMEVTEKKIREQRHQELEQWKAQQEAARTARREARGKQAKSTDPAAKDAAGFDWAEDVAAIEHSNVAEEKKDSFDVKSKTTRKYVVPRRPTKKAPLKKESNGDAAKIITVN